jgi:hypothetical protein
LVTAELEQDSSGKNRVVFTVPLPRRDPVFMSLTLDDYSRECSGVVIVDSAKFLQLWRSEPNSIHSDMANGSPETWPSNYKFELATNGFSHGKANPVPLAEVSFGIDSRNTETRRFFGLFKELQYEDVPFVAFTNGITRTIWLLTQGCTAFPVECNRTRTQELHQVAAAPGTSAHTADEIAKAGCYLYPAS